MALKTNHKYIYQVQAQMHVTLWYGHHRSYDPFFFNNAYLKVVEFIKTGVLLFLKYMGKLFWICSLLGHTMNADTYCARYLLYY